MTSSFMILCRVPLSTCSQNELDCTHSGHYVRPGSASYTTAIHVIRVDSISRWPRSTGRYFTSPLRHRSDCTALGDGRATSRLWQRFGLRLRPGQHRREERAEEAYLREPHSARVYALLQLGQRARWSAVLQVHQLPQR